MGLPPATAPLGRPAGTEHVAVEPLRGRTGAYLTVRDAASRVRVTFAVLPGLLYRISTPADSGLAPLGCGTGGQPQVCFRRTSGDGPDDVSIVLNRDVRWDIRLPAGAGEQQLDLTGGRVTRVDLGPSGLAELRLPAPAGTVPVTFTQSVGRVVMTVPGAPVRLRLDLGAGPVVTPWAVRAAAGAGEVLEEPGWPVARDRYAVAARSTVGSLLLDRLGR